MFRSVILLMAVFGIFFQKGFSDEQHWNVPSLTLNAQATLQRNPDELTMTVGVVSIGSTAEKALDENNDKMHAIIASLEKMGMTKSEYQTSQFSIHPTYTPYPKDAPPDWRAAINGYEVNNSILIKTDRIAQAGHIIDRVNKAGANSIDNISFGLKDSRLYWEEAVKAAVGNARADAEAMAAVADVALVRLLLISLDGRNVVQPRVNAVRFAKMEMASAPPIEAGEFSVTAGVSVTYEIAPK